jgi:rRNA biogenesis protein RRP5
LILTARFLFTFSFAVGQTLKARVLYVEERQKKIICTLKKNLLNSSLPKFFDYTTPQIGVLAHGYIASVKDYGLIVEFYNKVHGLVSTQDLVRTSFLKEGQVPSDVFKRGDVHKVRVVFCDVKKQRMKLSLGLVAPKHEASDDPDSIDVLAAPGTIVSGTVKEVKKDGLIVTLEDEHAPAQTKGKKDKAAPVKAQHSMFLPSGHLTDHSSLADALLHTYPVGHRFPRLLVLHKDKSLKMPIVSAKPSFLAFSAASSQSADSPYLMPSSVDILQPGALLLGFIRGITGFGVFVGFLDDLSALATRSMLADQFVAGELTEAFQVGQTVRAKVISVEQTEAAGGAAAATKVNVSLKPSQLAEDAPADAEAQVLALEGAFVTSFFTDSSRIASSLATADAGQIDWSSYSLGGEYKGEIKLIKDFGLVLEGPSSGVQGLVTRPYHTSEPATKKELIQSHKKSAATESEITLESGEKYALGQEVKGRVLDVDRVKKIVDVSLRSELLDAPKEVAGKKKGSKASSSGAEIKKGTWVPVKVQLVRKKYVVLSLPQSNNAIGYAMVASTNSRFDPHSVFQPGYETKALVHEVAKNGPDGRLLLVLDLASAISTYSKNKKANGIAISFIDPNVTKLSDLQNGLKLTVKLRGLTQNADPSTAGPNSRLEAIIGEINSKVLVGTVHITQLEEELHVRAAAGDKEAKRVLKEHATTPYAPLAAWAARSGEQIPARIMSIIRRTYPAKAGKKESTRIATVDLTLKPSVIEQEAAVSSESGESPALPHLTASSLSVNQIVQVYVKDVETHEEQAAGALWVVVAPGLKGRIRANELSFPAGSKIDLSKYKAGQALTAQVLEVHESIRLVELALLPLGTTKPKKFDEDTLARVKAESASHHSHGNVLKEGSIVRDLTVKKVFPTGLLVAFGETEGRAKFGRIHVTDLSDKLSATLLKSFREGQRLPKAIVVGVTVKQETVYRGAESMDVDEDGEESKEPEASRSQTQTDLSLRVSRLAPKKAHKLKYPEINSFEDLIGKEGTKLQGFVKSTTKVGCFISLGRNVIARCMMKNLSDGFVTDPARHFPAGKFLPLVRVVKVDPEARTIEVSLRKGEGAKGALPGAESKYTWEDVHVGDNVKGVITQIKTFGLFIRLKDSALSGLCHISEVSDTFIDDLSKHYEVGDKVRARIVKKDDATKKISFGLKAKYFADAPPDSDAEEDDEEEAEVDVAAGDADEEPEEQDIEEEDEHVAKPSPKQSPKQTPKAKKESAKRKAAESSEEEQEEEVEMDDARAKKKARVSAAPKAEPLAALPSTMMDDGELADAPALSLDLNSSFSMLTGGSNSAAAEEAEASDLSEDDDDADGDATAKKKSRRAKAGAKKAEERALLTKEHAILDPNAQPESAEEFERIIVQNPNASMVWIKFMAYQSQSHTHRRCSAALCLFECTNNLISLTTT